MSKDGVAGKGRATPYIGVLHQEYTLYPFDTVLQNLSTCIGVNMPAELAKMKAIQVLISVGFDKKDVNRILEAYPDTLSVGECQRIAFAQVLIKEPRIVILDEPTGTMDPITKVIVAKSVLRARETLGETFVVVSHDMDFVQNCCDRAAFMQNGKVVASVVCATTSSSVSNWDILLRGAMRSHRPLRKRGSNPNTSSIRVFPSKQPGVPRIRPLGFLSSLRSTIIRLLDRALIP